MGLLTKEVDVKWTQGVRKYYEEKGYTWTKLYDIFTIPTTDLPQKSNMRVSVQCDYCDDIKDVRYSTYLGNYQYNEVGLYACLKCISGLRDKLPLKEVRSRVKALGKGYTLLSEEYLNGKSPIKVKCPLNHVYTTTMGSIRLDCKCPICHDLFGNRGSSNPNYNPNLTDEERLENRDTSMNIKWRENIYERDNYTCQKCGDVGEKLNAHHLNGYHWDKVNRFSLDNGVTLCVECHKEYHSIYGSRDTVKEDYYKWINEEGATA